MSSFLWNPRQAAEDLSPNHKDESIVWKFGQLDRNGNNYLEAKETASFATEIDLIKSSKKCRNNFLDFCDANQDSRLALKEWLHCFDITPGECHFVFDFESNTVEEKEQINNQNVSIYIVFTNHDFSVKIIRVFCLSYLCSIFKETLYELFMWAAIYPSQKCVGK